MNCRRRITILQFTVKRFLLKILVKMVIVECVVWDVVLRHVWLMVKVQGCRGLKVLQWFVQILRQRCNYKSYKWRLILRSGYKLIERHEKLEMEAEVSRRITLEMDAFKKQLFSQIKASGYAIPQQAENSTTNNERPIESSSGEHDNVA